MLFTLKPGRCRLPKPAAGLFSVRASGLSIIALIVPFPASISLSIRFPFLPVPPGTYLGAATDGIIQVPAYHFHPAILD
jgi:hypothetical protein